MRPPAKTERAAIARKPVSPQHHVYEREKQRWVARHPNATPAQYEIAMARIARECGI